MVIRIRLDHGPQIRRKRPVGRSIALALSSLLTPIAVFAGVLALWRVGADMSFTSSFAIRDGLFSHWQVWVGVALMLEFAAILLNRHARKLDRDHTS
jgi:hypothetical protein